MQVFYDNYVENQGLYHTFTEPLFLKPDGTRTRYPIGWNGYGRYMSNTLKVTYNGLPCNISEESNGIWFNFDIAPGENTNYEDYTISYVVRSLDYAFSVGLSEGGYEGEEYFLFPNWNNALGEGDAFWIGKWQASDNGNNIPQSKSRENLWCNITRDDAINACKSKGNKFGIVTNRKWVSIALWCDHHEIHVKGNIYGNQTDNLDGDGTSLNQCGGGYNANNDYYFVTGATIPDTWNHNNRSNGIHNMVGNIWETMDGLENRSGKIYIYDKNNNYVNSGVNVSNKTNGNIVDIMNTTEDILNEGIPNAVSSHGYVPSNLDEDYVFYFNNQTTIFRRGGNSDGGLSAGLWSVWMTTLPGKNWNLGFRLAKDLV